MEEYAPALLGALQTPLATRYQFFVSPMGARWAYGVVQETATTKRVKLFTASSEFKYWNSGAVTSDYFRPFNFGYRTQRRQTTFNAAPPTPSRWSAK